MGGVGGRNRSNVRNTPAVRRFVPDSGARGLGRGALRTAALGGGGDGDPQAAPTEGSAHMAADVTMKSSACVTGGWRRASHAGLGWLLVFFGRIRAAARAFERLRSQRVGGEEGRGKRAETKSAMTRSGIATADSYLGGRADMGRG